MKQDGSYDVDVLTQEDIINNIEFESEQQKILTNEIITDLESQIAEGFKQGKCVQLPFIGSARINKAYKELMTHKDEFKIARKRMNKDDYKKHVYETYNIIKAKLHNDELTANYIKLLKSKNKKKYDRIYKKFGKIQAETYIFALSLMREIPFNLEVQETFDRLNNEY